VDRRSLLARGAGAIALSLGIAACGPTPNPSPEASTVPPAAELALACWTVSDEECRAIFQAALARQPVGRPPAVAARVMAYGCESGPCAPGVLARGQGQVLIEYAGGAGLVSWELTLGGGGGLAFSPATETAGIAAQPQSRRAAAPVSDLSLDHCGLYSPIDFDGSFWNPLGPVDGDAPEAINAAPGTIRLVGPQEAQFRAPSGFTVRLRRHPGAKAFQGCA
jgi:hypothetical protein